LDGRHRLHRMSAPDGVRAWFGQTEMLDLASGDQIPDCAGDLLDRNVGVNAVLVEKVDGVDPQALERVLSDLADAFGAAVEATRSAGTEVVAELRGDDDVLPERLQRLANEFLVGERAIDLGGVEEGDTTLYRRADQRDHFRPVPGRATVIVHAHAAQAVQLNDLIHKGKRSAHRARFSRHALKLRLYLKYGSGPRLISRTYPPQWVLCEIAAFIALCYPSRQLL
jgi:hypothetical protein